MEEEQRSSSIRKKKEHRSSSIRKKKEQRYRLGRRKNTDHHRLGRRKNRGIFGMIDFQEVADLGSRNKAIRKLIDFD